ncbi:hypothetical protein ACFL34_03185 [Candidatus Sumerlaeota bacterium]
MKKAKMVVAALGITSIILFAGCGHGRWPAEDHASSVRRTSPMEAKQSLSISQLPDVVQKALEDSFPKGDIVGVEKEIEGKDVGQYDVDIRSGGKLYEVEVSPEGKIIEKKEVLSQEVDRNSNERPWQKEFNLSKRALLSKGRNPYFILEPGFQLAFASEDEKLVITVLDETVDVAGVKTRVVEEREWQNGELVEVSRNFFAICKDTKDVFYFGEDVNDYKKGQVTGHGGAWRADASAARPGLIMSGSPSVGMKYFQEIAPGLAMDRAEVISLNETLETPAGAFDKCLKTQEGSALKPREKQFKTYAPGIGLIQDEDLLLVRHGFIKK